ncbi:MAG: hypothetical protein GX591_02505, partial [Planctomycetes bacterium]|nr:hypothetical protein [Planctomycetota bacterium]
LPLLCNVPFTLVLIVARVALPTHDVAALLTGVLGGGAVLAVTYWLWALPSSVKTRILRRLGRRGSIGEPAVDARVTCESA